jgi:hypothetical protein
MRTKKRKEQAFKLITKKPDNKAFKTDRRWTAIKIEHRSSLSIAWFDTEEEATSFGDHIEAIGEVYCGGFFDGMPHGRDTGFDITREDGTKLFAATFQYGHGLNKTY